MLTSVTLSFKSHCFYAYSYFCGLKHSKSHCFSCQFTKMSFEVPMQKYVSLAASHLVPNTFSPRTFGPPQLVPKNKQSRLIWSTRQLVPLDNWSPNIWSPWTNGPQDNWSPWTNGPQTFGPHGQMVPQKIGPHGQLVPKIY